MKLYRINTYKGALEPTEWDKDYLSCDKKGYEVHLNTTHFASKRAAYNRLLFEIIQENEALNKRVASLKVAIKARQMLTNNVIKNPRHCPHDDV